MPRLDRQPWWVHGTSTLFPSQKHHYVTPPHTLCNYSPPAKLSTKSATTLTRLPAHNKQPTRVPSEERMNDNTDRRPVKAGTEVQALSGNTQKLGKNYTQVVFCSQNPGQRQLLCVVG